MGWWANLKQKVRDSMLSFLEVAPPVHRSFRIRPDLDFTGRAIKNRMWYRGQASELEMFWKQVPGESNRQRFWSAVPPVGREIEKIHVGLPSLMVDTLVNIVVSDLQQIDAGEGEMRAVWEEIADENRLYDLLTQACTDALVIGDGAFRVSLDAELSELPIIEFVPGDRCEFVRRRGRLVEIRFLSREDDDMTLVESYQPGRIVYTFRKGEGEFAPSQVGSDLPDSIEWDGGFTMAVPLSFFPSSVEPGRGGSVFDSRDGGFDALDECWSQWMDALRKARTKEYVPEQLVPRNPANGQIIKPSAFDNAYFMAEGSMAEGAGNKIEVVQPEIRQDGYLATYTTALDLCLMGLVSPSTLGIDVKKLDNAEAQREKEKATLYTRNKMVTVLQEALPKLVEAAVNAWRVSQGMQPADMDVSVEFGEYANPSFEAMVETVGKARVQGIMSTEAVVEELYGDTRDDEWKAAEVARLKAEHGMAEVDAPTVGITWADVIGGADAGQGGGEPVRDDGAGDAGTAGDGAAARA